MNPDGRPPVTCIHGVVGKSKCETCQKAAGHARHVARYQKTGKKPTGRPPEMCSHGNVGKKKCKDCVREWEERRTPNRPAACAKAKRYRERHPERASAAQRRWVKKNPDKIREHVRNAKLKRRAAFSDVTLEQRREVWDRGFCQHCGTNVGPFSIDHVIPLSKGGLDTFLNLVLACLPCNKRKGTRFWWPQYVDVNQREWLAQNRGAA